MKKSALVSLLVLVVLLLSAVPGQAWHHPWHRGVFIGVGPWWGPGYPYAWYPPPYYGPPTVVVQEPPTYVEQPPAAPAPPQAYWYYCPSARGYYPTVQACSEAWVKVPPRAE
jgi:hypothetical protein